MCIGKNITDSILLNFDDQILRRCREFETLGITLGRKLKFTSHRKKLCRKLVQT